MSRVNITLDARDEAVLRRLRRGDATVGALADATSCPPGNLRARLPDLADNGLVRHVGDDQYAITDSGRRAIAETPAGAMNDRIDTPDAVESRLRSFDLRADREAAVRGAFAFLRYWGEALPAEILDAVYSETPAGYPTAEAWWADLVADHLAALPFVDPGDAWDDPWRYTGTPSVERDARDGRSGPATGPGSTDPFPLASVKDALERLDVSDAERAAIRRAFATLAREGEASAETLQRTAYRAADARGESPAAPWETVREGLDQLPGVERTCGGDGWEYQQHPLGPASTDAGTPLPGDESGAVAPGERGDERTDTADGGEEREE